MQKAVIFRRLLSKLILFIQVHSLLPARKRCFDILPCALAAIQILTSQIPPNSSSRRLGESPFLGTDI